MLCQNYTKHSPQWKLTHNTQDCCKWDAQENLLDRQAKNIHAHGKQNAAIMECFQQMRKDNLKLVNALSKKKKRACKSKKPRVLVDSDSSDSDSEWDDGSHDQGELVTKQKICESNSLENKSKVDKNPSAN